MARPTVNYVKVERGIRKVIRTYADERTVEKWQVRLANASGKVVTHGTYPTLAIARRELTNARKAVQDRNYNDPARGRVKFKQVADDWYASTTGQKASTRRGHLRCINRAQLLHDEPMNRLDYETLVRFQNSLGHLAPATRWQTMWCVKAICESARKRKLVAVNPCLDLPKISKRKPQITIPEPDEVERLISYLARPAPDSIASPDPRWSLLVETAAFSGLRAGELVGLKKADFNHARRSLHVRRAIAVGELDEDAPKSDAGIRIVDDLDPGLCRRLAQLADGLAPGDYLFGWKSKDGTSHPYRHGNFYRRVFKPACKAIGIDIRFHDLRHFNASLLIDAGLTPVEVAARLGHSSAAFTLNTYVHLFKKESTGLGELIAQRRAEARGSSSKVVSLRPGRAG